MPTLQLGGFFLGKLATRFSGKRIYKKATAHTNSSVNPPNGKLNASPLERFSPSENMLVDTIDERPVKIK